MTHWWRLPSLVRFVIFMLALVAVTLGVGYGNVIEGVLTVFLIFGLLYVFILSERRHRSSIEHKA